MSDEKQWRCRACGFRFRQGQLVTVKGKWSCPRCKSHFVGNDDEQKKGPFKYDEVEVSYIDGEEN